MYLFIGNINRTTNLRRNSISIQDELQERVNSASFSVSWFSPSYLDDVKIYEGYPIVSATSTSVTLKKSYWEAIQNNVFRIGEKVTVAIGESIEVSVKISGITFDWDNIRIIVPTLSNTPTAWMLFGKKRFAGNIIDIQDANKEVLGNIEFQVTALDYTRIFDKKLINDTFEDRDARYIINDFCNTTVNRNIWLEEFNYANTTALRAIWTNNPTLDTSDYREWDSCMRFTYGSVGTWSTVATIPSVDISEMVTRSEVWQYNIVDEFGNNIVDEFGNFLSYTLFSSSGRLAFWYKVENVSSMTISIWSDSSNYVSKNITPESWWVYYDVKISDMSVTWSPDYTAITFLKVEIVSTSSATIRIDGIRILDNDFFRHYPYVQETIAFDNFRVNRVKPSETMQRIADSLSWYWYVDYDKYIWLFPNTTLPAPIQITETSNNFANLSISYDTSRLINRQVVRWGEETSESIYSQVVEGNSIAREWIMKNKFKNLVVKLNDGSSTDTMEATTNTTTVKATAHGLVTGDYIVNRTRSNAVRQITRIDADTFTVDAITWQTSGDSFSLFVSKLVWVEGINADASYDYMSNFNEKSIRSADTEATLTAGQFLLFSYNEVIPILVQRTDNVSVDLMKNMLWYSDGIFDGQPITDQTITSRSEAINTAQAMVNKYSNVVITATFTTEQEWLEAWQLIRIKDTTSSERNIDKEFIIQSVKSKQLAWWENRHVVTCSSLLFGMLELLQQILANNRKIKVNEDEVINNIEDANETLTVSDILITDIDGEIIAEAIVISDTITTHVIEPPFYWWLTWLPSEMQWDEFVWS
jgi:hypothetical protein